MRKHNSFFWQMCGGVFFIILLAMLWPAESDIPFSKLDVNDNKLLTQGKKVYAKNCASCHGANLEGQANWREKDLNGLYPAPPQDDTGHSWHHADQYLIDSVTNGLYLDGRPTNMPAYKNQLTEKEIISVLTFIKSAWSAEKRAIQKSIQKDSITSNRS